MNSNLLPTDCESLNDQFKMIMDVCDTISESSDLILLMHHGLWRDVPDLPPPGTYAQSDLVYWNANCDSVNTQFVDVIYDWLEPNPSNDRDQPPEDGGAIIKDVLWFVDGHEISIMTRLSPRELDIVADQVWDTWQ